MNLSENIYIWAWVNVKYSLCVVSRFVSIKTFHSDTESGRLNTNADGINYFHE